MRDERTPKDVCGKATKPSAMPHISLGCGGGGFQVTGAVTVYRKNETSSKDSKLALMANFMQLLKTFSFITSFITYNFRLGYAVLGTKSRHVTWHSTWPMHHNTAGSRNNCKHGALMWNGMLILFAMLAIMFLKLTSTSYSPYCISRRLYRVI